MKRLVSIFMVVVLVFAFSVTALAAASVYPSDTVGVIDVLSCTDSIFNLLYEWIHSPQRMILYNYETSSNVYSFFLVSLPTGVKVSSIVPYGTKYRINFSVSVKYLVMFNVTPGGSGKFGKFAIGSSTSLDFDYIDWDFSEPGTYDPEVNVPITTVFPTFAEAAKDSRGIFYHFNEDIRYPRGEKPPESSESSESSQPPPPVEPPKPGTPLPADPPVIPQGDGLYVVYDTALWNDFLGYVRTAIGSATNIGWLIIAILFGIPLILGIIKHFAKGGEKY